MGAHLHFVPFGKGGDASSTLESTNRLVKLVAFATVGPHYFVPVGGHSVFGALGYVRAAYEMDVQARAVGIENAHIFLAAGTGGTLAGLMAGLGLCNSKLQLTAIDIGPLWKDFRTSIAHLATATCAYLGETVRFTAQDVPLDENRLISQAYAVSTEPGLDAIRMLAQHEGIFLDPVYTGKAFAGMLDLVHRKKIERNTPLIFLHTGGAPALFAYTAELLGQPTRQSVQT